jgi:hypothetical protein
MRKFEHTIRMDCVCADSEAARDVRSCHCTNLRVATDGVWGLGFVVELFGVLPGRTRVLRIPHNVLRTVRKGKVRSQRGRSPKTRESR